jgi:hypothetical protein
MMTTQKLGMKQGLESQIGPKDKMTKYGPV